MRERLGIAEIDARNVLRNAKYIRWKGFILYLFLTGAVILLKNPVGQIYKEMPVARLAHALYRYRLSESGF